MTDDKKRSSVPPPRRSSVSCLIQFSSMPGNKQPGDSRSSAPRRNEANCHITKRTQLLISMRGFMDLQSRKMGTGPNLAAWPCRHFLDRRHWRAWRAFALVGFAIDGRFLVLMVMRDLGVGASLEARPRTGPTVADGYPAARVDALQPHENKAETKSTGGDRQRGRKQFGHFSACCSRVWRPGSTAGQFCGSGFAPEALI